MMAGKRKRRTMLFAIDALSNELYHEHINDVGSQGGKIK